MEKNAEIDQREDGWMG